MMRGQQRWFVERGHPFVSALTAWGHVLEEMTAYALVDGIAPRLCWSRTLRPPYSSPEFLLGVTMLLSL